MATFLKSLLAFIWSALVGFWLFMTYLDDGVSLQKGLTILIGLFLVWAGYIAYGVKTRMSGATAVGEKGIPKKIDDRIIRRLHTYTTPPEKTGNPGPKKSPTSPKSQPKKIGRPDSTHPRGQKDNSKVHNNVASLYSKPWRRKIPRKNFSCASGAPEVGKSIWATPSVWEREAHKCRRAWGNPTKQHHEPQEE